MNEPRVGTTEFHHPVPYRLRRATVPDAPVVVALHGHGMSAERFERVLRYLSPEQVTLITLQGPYPFELRKQGEIRIGHGWYLYHGDQAAFRRSLEQSEAFVLETLETIRAKHSITDRPLAVLGFSQGGYLAGFLALRNPNLFSELAIASARLKSEFLEEELTRTPLPRTLFLHSEEDAAVRWEAAEPHADRLRAAGGEVDLFFHDAGHRLPPEAVRYFEEWLGGRHERRE